MSDLGKFFTFTLSLSLFLRGDSKLAYCHASVIISLIELVVAVMQ